MSILGTFFFVNSGWSNNKTNNLSDSEICSLATYANKWTSSPSYFKYVVEAKRRNLLCNNPTNISQTWSWYKKKLDKGDLVAKKSLTILEKNMDDLVTDFKLKKQDLKQLLSNKEFIKQNRAYADYIKSAISEIDVTLKILKNKYNPNIQKSVSLTLEEIKKLQNHVTKCWKPPLSAKDISEKNIPIKVISSKDGKIKKVEIVEIKKYEIDENYRATADAAKQGIIKCGSLPLPPKKYSLWKTIILDFSNPFKKNEMKVMNLNKENILKSKPDKDICLRATRIGHKSIIIWEPYGDQSYVNEARTRGLSCSVGKKFVVDVSGGYQENDKVVCFNATDGLRGSWSQNPLKYKYVEKAKRRGLDCGVKENGEKIVLKEIIQPKNQTYIYDTNNINEWSNVKICSFLTKFTGKHIYSERVIKKAKKYADNWNLECANATETAIASKSKSNNSNSSQALEKEKQKRLALQRKAEEKEQKLLEEARKRKALEQRIAELEKKNKELSKAKKKEPAKPKGGSGSGFFISKLGHIITNHHVVNQCSKITVGDSIDKQVPAQLLETDKRNDLALLRTTTLKMASAETKTLIQKLSIHIVPLATGGLMRGNDIELGEDVLVAGFPYGDIFSKNIKVTKGIVSSTTGVGDDSGQFQLDAAVQPGNSGGPIYDKYGNIVGVVVAQLNKFKMAKTIGSLPENVNFGIKASTVKQFLNTSGLPTKWSERSEPMSNQELSKIASKQTVMVVCHRD